MNDSKTRAWVAITLILMMFSGVTGFIIGMWPMTQTKSVPHMHCSEYTLIEAGVGVNACGDTVRISKPDKFVP